MRIYALYTMRGRDQFLDSSKAEKIEERKGKMKRLTFGILFVHRDCSHHPLCNQ